MPAIHLHECEPFDLRIDQVDDASRSSPFQASTPRLNTSTFSCDIAYAVSRALRSGDSRRTASHAETCTWRAAPAIAGYLRPLSGPSAIDWASVPRASSASPLERKPFTIGDVRPEG